MITNSNPIPMILYCPICRGRHIDTGQFKTKPHHTHACQQCGHVWRPALIPTIGVQFLPGFKNDENESNETYCKLNTRITMVDEPFIRASSLPQPSKKIPPDNIEKFISSGKTLNPIFPETDENATDDQTLTKK